MSHTSSMLSGPSDSDLVLIPFDYLDRARLVSTMSGLSISSGTRLTTICIESALHLRFAGCHCAGLSVSKFDLDCSSGLSRFMRTFNSIHLLCVPVPTTS